MKMTAHARGRFLPVVPRFINTIPFVASIFGSGEARRGSIPRSGAVTEEQRSPSRKATQPSGRRFFGQTSLLAPYRLLKGMRVARASSGPKIPRRKRGRIYEMGYLVRALLLLVVGAEECLDVVNAADEPPFGIERRIPWTTTHVVGSPEPPLPYTVAKTLTNIPWKAPIFVTPAPDTDSLVVVQQGGEKVRPSRILRVRDEPNTDRVETFLEV